MYTFSRRLLSLRAIEGTHSDVILEQKLVLLQNVEHLGPFSLATAVFSVEDENRFSPTLKIRFRHSQSFSFGLFVVFDSKVLKYSFI